MALAASSLTQPRTLDTIASAPASASSATPVHDDVTSSIITCFEHRHLTDNTERQIGEVRRLCRRRQDGFFFHELSTLSRVLLHVAGRLEQLGSDAGELSSITPGLLLLCTRPFQLRLSSDEARFGNDASAVFEALAVFLSAHEQAVFAAAADTLESISLRLAALRPNAASPIPQPTPRSLAALDDCGAARAAVGAMHAARSMARQQRLCDLVLTMCRGSIGACRQLLERDAHCSGLEVPSPVLENRAPSARLVARKARLAPSDRGAPSCSVGTKLAVASAARLEPPEPWDPTWHLLHLLQALAGAAAAAGALDARHGGGADADAGARRGRGGLGRPSLPVPWRGPI